MHIVLHSSITLEKCRRKNASSSCFYGCVFRQRDACPEGVHGPGMRPGRRRKSGNSLNSFLFLPHVRCVVVGTEIACEKGNDRAPPAGPEGLDEDTV